jgi:hypothetical protein
VAAAKRAAAAAESLEAAGRTSVGGLGVAWWRTSPGDVGLGGGSLLVLVGDARPRWPPWPPTIESMLKPIFGLDGTATMGVGANGIMVITALWDRRRSEPTGHLTSNAQLSRELPRAPRCVEAAAWGRGPGGGAAPPPPRAHWPPTGAAERDGVASVAAIGPLAPPSGPLAARLLQISG